MKVSIIIPVYNEQNTIRAILEKVLALHVDKEVIVVNDCSSDDTEAILRSIKHPDLRVIHGIENRGKGHALRLGLKHIRGDVVLIQDADFEYDPADIPSLLEPIVSGNADVVYGSRFMEPNEHIPLKQLIANKYFNILTNLLHGSSFTDVCNCYKVFKAGIIKGIDLRSDGFEVCHEITANLVGEYCFKDVPIRYRPRTRAEGKKVSWMDIFPSTWAILRFGWRKAYQRLVRGRKKY
ncbi:MAG: glycosyltransferase family 2 protein [Candidatus Tritonobacter lacicola]|nr:glycosyltransferase family 2 protein [Candidatus Tritonobacter lacicola]